MRYCEGVKNLYQKNLARFLNCLFIYFFKFKIKSQKNNYLKSKNSDPLNNTK